MRHFKCDLQMNCCFHEWEKTKLEVKLLVRRGISRDMGPKAVWKGSYFRQSSSKRETWGWERKLFFRCIASISTILLSCWWSWSIALEAFSLGQESTWNVSVTGGSSLLATGRWCQSVYGEDWLGVELRCLLFPSDPALRLLTEVFFACRLSIKWSWKLRIFD